jgi:hypothetical protein
MTERKPDPDACTCGHLAADHAYYPPWPCELCECMGFDAAVPLEDMHGPCVLDGDHDVDHMDEQGNRWALSDADPAHDDEPVPYMPVPCVLLHLHTFADGVCTTCALTLADWQQELYGELAHIALDEDGA